MVAGGKAGNLTVWDVRDIELAALRAEIKALKRDIAAGDAMRREFTALQTLYGRSRIELLTAQAAGSSMMKENARLRALLAEHGVMTPIREAK